MILGTGIDLASISQMADQLAQPGTTFVAANFTAREIRTVRQRCADELPADQLGSVDALLGAISSDEGATSSPSAGPAPATNAATLAVARHLAVRWAAKEAVVKAWSAALYGQEPALPTDGPGAAAMTDIEVVHDHWKRPAIALHGAVAHAVADSLALVADRDDPPVWHLSLSHDGDVAIAQVILETA